MAGFTAPGIFFLAAPARPQLVFLRSLFEVARKAGYSKFVEPAAGAFAMSVLARQAGWQPSQFDTSDVALLSSVLGAVANGESIDALEIVFHAAELDGLCPKDPAHVLYAQMLSRYLLSAQKAYYWQQIVVDLKSRKDEILDAIRKQLDEIQKAIGGMRYRPLDMFMHLAEVLDDQQAIVSLNPPTIKAGFEKFFNTGGALTWKEPGYSFFDPKVDLQRIADMAKTAKALVILYEQQAFGESVMEPVFSIATAIKAKTDTGGVRTGSVYLTSNRPDEVTQLLHGHHATRKEGPELRPSEFPILPENFEPTDTTKIALVQLDEGHALYYRALWTHRFLGASGAMKCLAVLLDGHLAGVFAYNTEWLRLGKFGEADHEATASVFLQYAMAPRLDGWRLNRLLIKTALCRETVAWSVDPFSLVRVKWMITAQFTRMPEAKEMRGLMQLVGRSATKGKMGLSDGYMLRYRATVDSITISDGYQWWLQAERKYRAAKK